VVAAGFRPIIAFGVLCLVAACTPGRDATPTITSAVPLPEDASTGGETDGLLNSRERRRLIDAAQMAFEAPAGVTTSYTVAPRHVDAAPTVVSATASGPAATRADGRTCRPMTLGLVRDGKATIRDMIVCRETGSNELKPAES
jgi:hypothetical protein